MANFSLTAGADTVVGGAADDTVIATAAALNAGDSLTGGAGMDVLALVGGGTFRVDQLATFTGFERITLDATTSSFAQLYLGDQPIEVDATGWFSSIQVNSPSNWNGSDIINGDASGMGASTSIIFNQQWGLGPVTYDLTSNTFSHVSNINGNGDNLTLVINNADTAGYRYFSGSGQGDTLVTAGSTLDLSQGGVSGFTVASTNALGTTFTVGDLSTAFQIAGGPGQDTIVATGFTFSADQRNSIFATTSIEEIVDQTGTYTAPPPSPGYLALTLGNDTFAAPSSGSTVTATAAALNAGDSLTGGAGMDVLALVGGGTFRVDQLATFTGFERITLDATTSSFAQLYLGDQPIEVDATGWFSSIQVNSPSNWNGSDIINGDASGMGASTSIIFNQQWGLGPVTYDLTSNTFSHVSNINGNGDNLTLVINNADTAGYRYFSGSGQGDTLVTAGSTLDLSQGGVSGFTVASTNALGTTFTVGDLSTAFQIAGGPGQDTIVATGFTFSADQRNSIFATTSIEEIVDQTGTYTAPPPSPGYLALTLGNDTFAAPSSGSTVTATAAALNAGDSLTGGAGMDVLALVGGGTFRVDQLATFTGFERITLDATTSSFAQLYLGDQPIEVDATGWFSSIQVNSPSNWNGSDIINGDASGMGASTSIIFNQQWGLGPVTYDLTSNTFSHVSNINGNGDNLTLVINNADTAGYRYFSGSGQGDTLVTAGSTLDLSQGGVSGFTVASTNALGTTFTVGDLSTAFQIAGGPGQDTIVATGFTFSADQRNSIFATTSIEEIVDQTGTYATDIVPPTIAGTVSGQTTTSEAPVTPFAHATVGDANVGATDTLTIAVGGAGGTLSDGTGFNSLTTVGTGVYSLSGTAVAITSELDALVFTPKAGAPNTSSTTTFTLNDLSSAGGGLAVDSTTSVFDSDPAVAPTIARTVSGQRTTSEAPVRPFTHATVGDPNVGATDTLTITLGGAGGTLSGTGLSGGGGVYRLSGTAAAITSELGALVFTPTAGAPNTTSTTTFTLSDLSSANDAPTIDTATTVIDSDPAVAPTISGTGPGLTTTSETPVRPFAHATVGDANVGATDTLTITLGGAGGTLSDGTGFNSLTTVGTGVYSLSGTAAAITSELDALVFTPKAGAPNTSSTTTFTLSDLSSANDAPTVDTATTVIDSDPAVAPTISGTGSGLTTTSETPVRPFAHATVGDSNNGATDTLTITLGGAGGTLSDGTGFNSLTTVGTGVYSLSGTAAAITSELDALVFTPKAGAPNTSSTTTFTLNDLSSAGGGLAVDSTTSVFDSDPAVAPTIAGTVSGQRTTSEAPVRPFAHATVGDANVGATDSLTITLGGAGGTLSGTGVSGGVGGVYTLSGTAAAITSQLDALVFTPKAGAPNTSSTTTFTLSDKSSAGGGLAVDSTTSVFDSDPAVAPTIAGTVSGQRTTSEAPVRPFAHATVGDSNNGATDSLTITLGGAGGTLSGTGVSGGVGGVYTLSGTAAAITSQLDALVFTPKAGAPNTSSTTTFTLSDKSSAGGGPAVDMKTTVIDKNIAPPPPVVHPNNLALSGSVTGAHNFIDMRNFVASFGDLIGAFGTNQQAAQNWYNTREPIEQRVETFDGLDYVASYGDLITAFKSAGSKQAVLDVGATHFINAGYHEGRKTTFNGLDYIASYGDLINAFGANGDAGAYHYIENGASEGRKITFDGLDYIASYGDLIKALGANEQAGAEHFIDNGYREGRKTTFDGLAYIADYTDLMKAFGANNDAGATHYIDHGFSEHRSTSFNVGAYESAHPDLIGKYASDDAFLTAYINTYKTTGTFLT